MHDPFAPVPVREHELLQEFRVGGVRLTESRHRASSTIARHAHRQATVTVLIDGSFEEIYPFRRAISCQAPAVHVRPPGAPHLDRLGTLGAHNLVLELEDERFDSVRRYSSLFDEVRHLSGSELVSLTRRLRREVAIGDDATPLAVEGLTMELLAAASRRTNRALDRPAPWLRRVYDLLHDRFREPRLRLDELAAVAGVHPVHLARSFRAAYGASPGEFLRELRLDWATRQVQETGRPLAEIATDAGFADQSHFSRVFKATHGLPPGAWRRLHQT